MGRVSITDLFMLRMLLFALWFQNSHATQVYFTVGNHCHNTPAYFIFLNRMTFLHAFSKNVFVIIKNLYSGSYFQMSTKIFYKNRELVSSSFR